MQEILVFTILATAITFGLYKLKKSFNKPIECEGCNKSCEGCEIKKNIQT